MVVGRGESVEHTNADYADAFYAEIGQTAAFQAFSTTKNQKKVEEEQEEEAADQPALLVSVLVVMLLVC
jgi:hypothetical protein